jgi:hypothetical protein
MAERGTGDGERASGTVGKFRNEGGDVLVGDRPTLVAYGSPGGVAQRRAKGNRPVLDQDRQRRSVDFDDRTAELLAQVDQVTARSASAPEPSGPS